MFYSFVASNRGFGILSIGNVIDRLLTAPEVGGTASGKDLPHPQKCKKLCHVFLLANVSVRENNGQTK